MQGRRKRTGVIIMIAESLSHGPVFELLLVYPRYNKYRVHVWASINLEGQGENGRGGAAGGWSRIGLTNWNDKRSTGTEDLRSWSSLASFGDFVEVLLLRSTTGKE